VNAGHNAPMLRRQSGAIEMLEIGGLPLGVMDSAPYQSGTVTLQSGDWLVIYTDGVIEAQNIRNDEYGEARLTAMLHANASVSPAVLLDRIMFDLDVFVDGAPQHDDVTLMLLRST
jgi:phosphoserine phosphatase RsbU/P